MLNIKSLNSFNSIYIHGYAMSTISISANNIDLDLSMYPSFVSALFIKQRNKWIKIAGYGIGAEIAVKSSKIICKGCDRRSFSEWTGLWFNPNDYIQYISKSFAEKTSKLIKYYNNLRIIVSSRDKPFILTLTFLSRNTDYHRNVRRWSRIIFNNLEYFEPHIIAKRINSMSKRSFQLNQLLEILDEISSINFDRNPWILRRELMEIKYLGPKVVDAFLLFSGYDTIFTPSDIHLRRFSLKIGLIKNDKIIVPSKKYC